MKETLPARTAAEVLLARMKARGVDYLFGNAGTDFPSLIEAFAAQPRTGLDLPRPVLVAHESAAVAMAHGYALATGRAQAAMVHVNVGLANALMGVINAAADNVPLLMCSGRTPVTEHGRHGSRTRPIHWGQEMRDQGGMLRDVVKWDYELRYPEQAGLAVERALAIAMSDPPGPVYLSLPREVLAEPAPAAAPLDPRLVSGRAGAPAPAALDEAARLLADAETPVIVAQRQIGGNGQALAEFAERFAIPVTDFWATRNPIATTHPMHAGGDPARLIEAADVILAVDAPVPWEMTDGSVGLAAAVIGLGPDPLFARTPMRGFAVDLALQADPAEGLAALAAALDGRPGTLARTRDARHARVVAAGRKRRAAAADRAAGGAGRPMSAAWVSRCVSEARAPGTIVVNELGCDVSVMEFEAPGTLFTTPLSGGLGWGLGAALGLQLADRETQVIACVGDGSYIFANPTACHMAAMAEALPVLTIVFNNGIWNAVKRATLGMYPDGEAARSNAMPLTSLSPAPDYAALARAHGLWAERVDDGAALPATLAEALRVTGEGRRPALIEVVVA